MHLIDAKQALYQRQSLFDLAGVKILQPQNRRPALGAFFVVITALCLNFCFVH